MMKDPVAANHSLLRWLCAALFLLLVADALLVHHYFLLIQSIQPSSSPIDLGKFFSERDGSFEIVATNLRLLFSIATIALFLVWIHRAYRNLIDYGVAGLRFTPGWAVGYWFVPVLNLFRPYQVMKEIGEKSASGKPLNTFLMMAWWIFFFLSNIHLNFRFAGPVTISKDRLLQWHWLILAVFSSEILSGILLIFILLIVDRRQRKDLVRLAPPVIP